MTASSAPRRASFLAAATAALLMFCGLLSAPASEVAGDATQQAEGSGNAADPLARGPDPIMADVDGHSIHLSEVGDAIRDMPDGGAGVSFETLYPIVVGRLVQRTELALRARNAGLDQEPAVRRRIDEATDQVLENAYLRREGMKEISEGALLARYNAEIAGKPGPEEVHAQVILVGTERAAADAIAKLGNGADFSALAHQVSLDASAAKGGDLGFVNLDGLGPEIGAALFELKPGEVTPYPVRANAGWFVLKCEARRRGPTPSFAESRDHLVTEMLREQVAPLAREALSEAVVRLYDVNGRELTGDKASDDTTGTDPALGK